jgi:hypothetical protein
MALSPIQCLGFLPQNHHLMSLLWNILYGDRLCKMNLMHLSRTSGILFHHELDSMSLILNGVLNSSIILMALLLATKLVWWPRDSSSSMVLIIMLHLVLSSRLLFACCYLWRSPVIGLFSKLISKMQFCMVFLMKMCT